MMASKENRNSFTDLILSQQIKTIEFGESPLEELGIETHGTDDIQELQFILSKILTYPSTELAKLHKRSNKLGTNDLKDDHGNNFNYEEMKQVSNALFRSTKKQRSVLLSCKRSEMKQRKEKTSSQTTCVDRTNTTAKHGLYVHSPARAYSWG